MIDRLVLVTGGRGFIGRVFCQLLQREGYRVLALDQPETPSAALQYRPELSEVDCDIRRASHLWQVFQAEPIDSVVHLAGILPTAAREQPLLATQVNITGGVNLFEMVRQFKVRRVVLASSLSIYGSCPVGDIVAETHVTIPEDLYGVSKLYVEQLAETYRARFGVPFMSLRMGRVVGPGSKSAFSAWRSRIFEELPSADATEISLPYAGSEQLLLVHVDDVARMLLTLVVAPNPNHRIYNAVCEPMLASELKRTVESLNPKIRVKLGEERAAGNPRSLDSRRFAGEFSFHAESIAAQLKRAAGK